MARKNVVEETLRSLGLGSVESRTIALMDVHGPVRQRELERELDIPQPSASITLKDLMSRGWADLVDHEPPKTGKGRPTKVYSLKRTPIEIAYELKNRYEQRVVDAQHAIDALVLNQ